MSALDNHERPADSERSRVIDVLQRLQKGECKVLVPLSGAGFSVGRLVGGNGVRLMSQVTSVAEASRSFQTHDKDARNLIFREALSGDEVDDEIAEIMEIGEYTDVKGDVITHEVVSLSQQMSALEAAVSYTASKSSDEEAARLKELLSLLRQRCEGAGNTVAEDVLDSPSGDEDIFIRDLERLCRFGRRQEASIDDTLDILEKLEQSEDRAELEERSRQVRSPDAKTLEETAIVKPAPTAVSTSGWKRGFLSSPRDSEKKSDGVKSQSAPPIISILTGIADAPSPQNERADSGLQQGERNPTDLKSRVEGPAALGALSERVVEREPVNVRPIMATASNRSAQFGRVGR